MEAVQLHPYQPSLEGDSLLLRWYGHLIETKDLAETFVKEAHPLSAFLQTFQPPRLLGLGIDEQGVWFASWYEPMMAGAYFGTWCRKEKRGTKQWLAYLERALEIGLSAAPTLIGFTPHENLLDSHIRMGYTVLGKVPSIFDGKDAYIVFITNESFANRKVHSRETAGEVVIPVFTNGEAKESV